MSERPWTPGPWKAVRSDPAEGADVWWLIAGEGNYETEIGALSGGFPHDKRAANARLIAAAPELFELLVKAREHVGPVIYRDGPRQEDCERCDALLVEIDAALAKAKGQE